MNTGRKHRKGCRNNHSIYSYSSTPIFEWLSSWKLLALQLMQWNNLWEPRILFSAVTWVPWNSARKLSWYYSETFVVVIDRPDSSVSDEDEVIMSRKTVRHISDCGRYFWIWRGISLIFFSTRERGCGKFNVIWVMLCCRTELSNEITFLPSVVTPGK